MRTALSAIGGPHIARPYTPVYPRKISKAQTKVHLATRDTVEMHRDHSRLFLSRPQTQNLQCGLTPRLRRGLAGVIVTTGLVSATSTPSITCLLLPGLDTTILHRNPRP